MPFEHVKEPEQGPVATDVIETGSRRLRVVSIQQDPHDLNRLAQVLIEMARGQQE
jgi:hypothetical protein